MKQVLPMLIIPRSPSTCASDATLEMVARRRRERPRPGGRGKAHNGRQLIVQRVCAVIILSVSGASAPARRPSTERQNRDTRDTGTQTQRDLLFIPSENKRKGGFPSLGGTAESVELVAIPLQSVTVNMTHLCMSEA